MLINYLYTQFQNDLDWLQLVYNCKINKKIYYLTAKQIQGLESGILIEDNPIEQDPYNII